MLKKKSRTMCLGLLVSAALTGCSSLNHISDNRFSQSKVISEREGFSIHEISDDLFDRMKAGMTYKEDCIVPREDLRYLLVNTPKCTQNRKAIGQSII